jgi:transcriptional regulator with XRE-family HTH domain
MAKKKTGFAALLTQYRKDAGVTQTAIAKKLRLTISKYKEFETGKTVPDLQTARKIASFLEFTKAEDLDFIRAALHGQLALVKLTLAKLEKPSAKKKTKKAEEEEELEAEDDDSEFSEEDFSVDEDEDLDDEGYEAEEVGEDE